MKEDEYLRDGVTEDIITELSKIKGLKILSRPTVLPYRDKSVTAAQVGQQLKAAFVLAGSIRRGGNRLRITAQLVDAPTDSLVWSERYDREMADVFEVQDEIARKIAQALRITLSPQEQEALAAKPTDNLQAYDLYLRGKSYARRLTRQDLEFALQMFENAVALDPRLRPRPRRHRQLVRPVQPALRPRAPVDRAGQGGEPARRAPSAATRRTSRSRRPGSSTPRGSTTRRCAASARRSPARATPRAPTTSWAGRSSPPASTRRSPTWRRRRWPRPARTTTSTCPSTTRSGPSGRRTRCATSVLQRIQVLEAHLKKFPEDARGRTLLATDYAHVERVDDAFRDANLAMALRPNDAMVMYNVACVFGQLGRKPEALEALRKAKDAGWKDATWARRDPDLAILHGDPEFEKLYPPAAAE